MGLRASCRRGRAVIAAHPGRDIELHEGKQLMEIFVANIPFGSVEDDVLRLFDGFGTVKRVNIIRDRETGKSRGFGFVEMADEEEARSAVKALDGIGLQGRSLSVSEARSHDGRPSRGG